MKSGTKIDRRIVRTKEAINRAFLEVFTEKEIERITINEIADRANVNRATVYLHYVDKYDLLERSIEEHVNKMLHSCTFTKIVQKKITNSNETIESLKAVFVFFEEHFTFYSAMLTQQKTSIFRESMLKAITETIRKQIDMQGINQSMDEELIVNFTASAFVGTVEWWILNRMPHPPQAMAERVAELLKRNNIF